VNAAGNPYRAAPGSEPPELAGRVHELGAVDTALAMGRAGQPAKPIVFTGLRGMGKTALLRTVERRAKALDGVVLFAETDASLSFGETLQRSLRRATAGTASLPKHVAAALRAFEERLLKISYELPTGAGSLAISAAEVDAERESRSGDALENLLDSLSEQLFDREQFLVLAIDEIQEGARLELLRLIRAVHRTAGGGAPITFFGAGLSQSPSILRAVRAYTERWSFQRLGLLDAAAVEDAIAIPACALGVRWEPAAIAAIDRASGGYPYFVQELASAAWAAHAGDTIHAADVERALPGAMRALDHELFDEQFAQLTPREMRYALALHDLGPGAHRSDEIVAALDRPSSELSSIRSQLLKKDVIAAPSRGVLEFQLPLTSSYIERHRRALQKTAALARP